MINPIARLLLAGTCLVFLASPGSASPAVSPDQLLADWLAQDAGMNVAKVLAELPADVAKPLAAELAAHKATKATPKYKVLYVKACRVRRVARLKTLTKCYPKIVYVAGYNVSPSFFAYTEGQSDAQNENHFLPNSKLMLLDLAKPLAPTTSVLLSDPAGALRDPAISHDGKRVLFAWKKSHKQDDYHLYEMDVAAKKLRQITRGKGVADFEGAYLPNGDIVFSSSRCVQTVDCWWTEVSNLYTCDPDGRYLRRLGFDQVHTVYPKILADGRVIYTRWDYNDRGQVFPQGLFQMNADGTGQMELYGNNSFFPTTLSHCRGIDGTKKILGIAMGHHTAQMGKLVIVDPAKGRQENTGVQLIAPVRETPNVRIDAYGQRGELFQYPYPISETECIVGFSPKGGPRARGRKTGHGAKFGLYWMASDGKRELLAMASGKLSCKQPVPLAVRATPHQRPTQVDYTKTTGVYYVQDIYEGPGLKGIKRGTIKALRVVALDFRAAGVGYNNSRGPAGGALVSTPIAIGGGSWDVKRVLGTAKVHSDGSASFVVPARTPVYFQALDEHGRTVQTMRSWSTLQPGETFGCVGCHEDKNAAAPTNLKSTYAGKSAPQQLAPFYGPARGFSFIKEIQPILDKHCISCHKHPAKAGAAKLSKATKTISPKEAQWSFTTTSPGKGWFQSGFAAKDWETAQAGFGTKGTPAGSKRHATWKTDRIWMRREVTLPKLAKGESLMLHVCHDEDVTIYLAGQKVASRKGFVTGFVSIPIRPANYKESKAILAVECRQTTGGQFIDVALVVTKAAKKGAFSLLGKTISDKRSKRNWSQSYLNLTGYCKTKKLVTWISSQSVPTMLPPNYSGAVKSPLWTMLHKGHNKVKLSREELEKLACWIDLLVPYCGSYTEASAWSPADTAKYKRYFDKRKSFEAEEARNIRDFLDGKKTPAPAWGEIPAQYRTNS